MLGRLDIYLHSVAYGLQLHIFFKIRYKINLIPKTSNALLTQTQGHGF